MSEKPTQPYGATQAEANRRAFSEKLRRYTKEPAGPLEVLVMCLGRELHGRERPGEDWFSLDVGTWSVFDQDDGTATGYCARACDARGISWPWVLSHIDLERLSPLTMRF